MPDTWACSDHWNTHQQKPKFLGCSIFRHMVMPRDFYIWKTLSMAETFLQDTIHCKTQSTIRHKPGHKTILSYVSHHGESERWFWLDQSLMILKKTFWVPCSMASIMWNNSGLINGPTYLPIFFVPESSANSPKWGIAWECNRLLWRFNTSTHFLKEHSVKVLKMCGEVALQASFEQHPILLILDTDHSPPDN